MTPLMMLLSAVPALAQGPAKPDPKKPVEPPDPNAYYTIHVGDEAVGVASLKPSKDASERNVLEFGLQAPVTALTALESGKEPDTRGQSGDVIRIDLTRISMLDAEGRLLEIVHKSGSALGRTEFTATYSNGRWETTRQNSGEPLRTGGTGEMEACYPTFLETLWVLGGRKELKAGAKIEKKIFSATQEDDVILVPMIFTVTEVSKRVGHDNEERDYLRVTVTAANPAGEKVFDVSLWVGADGVVDEFAVGKTRMRRVKDEAAQGDLGGIAGGRRDIFEQAQAEDPGVREGVTTVEPGVTDVTDTGLDDLLTKLEADLDAVVAEPDQGKQLELARKLYVETDSLKKNPKLKLSGPQSGRLDKVIRELKARFPGWRFHEFEAQKLLLDIFDALAKNDKDTLKTAEAKLRDLERIISRPDVKGTEGENKIRDLHREGKLSIGKHKLSKYLGDVVVVGIVYRRTDVMEPVDLDLSFLGAPLMVREQMPVLHPRGLCLVSSPNLTKGERLLKEVYREGDYFDFEDEKLQIRIKAVHQNKVTVEGDGAEVDILHPPPKKKEKDR